MIKKIIFPIILTLCAACTSVKVHNERLTRPITAEKLHQDIDHAYKQLQLFHPKLYWYISKNELDKKFDSLKTTITSPLKPIDFYQKLSPVIADIKEGHLRIRAPYRKLSKDELKKLRLQKGLLSRMEYWVENNKLYIKENKDNLSDIKVGTEILEVNKEKVSDLVDRYSNYITADGYNTTFLKYGLSQAWTNYFTLENGLLDSVQLKTKYNNEIKEIYIKREKITKEQAKDNKEEERDKNKSQENKVKDYNHYTKDFNRKLSFIDKANKIAYMKITTFSGKYSRQFYEDSFEQIKEKNAQYLIIDVRDNLGGSLAEIHHLYSFLIDDRSNLLLNIEVTRKNSMLKADYIKGIIPSLKPLGYLTYPLYAIGSLIGVKEKNGKFYARKMGGLSTVKPNKNNFKGKIFVLVNGSSFSASSILASKLKNDGRATIVGEETGGANDGTVAGRYHTYVLPYSRLKMPIGLMLIQPDIKFSNSKKGVIPNITITPSLEDRFNRYDRELEWIKAEILNSKALL